MSFVSHFVADRTTTVATTTTTTTTAGMWNGSEVILSLLNLRALFLCLLSCVFEVVWIGVRGLQLSDFTTFSMGATWESLGSKVHQYKVSYISTRGDRAEQVVSTDLFRLPHSTVTLQSSFTPTHSRWRLGIKNLGRAQLNAMGVRQLRYLKAT